MGTFYQDSMLHNHSVDSGANASLVVNTDIRFTDARTPTVHDDVYHTSGYLVNTTPYAVNTDTRFTNARTPTVHDDVYHVSSYPTNTIFAAHIANATAHSGGGGSDPWTYLVLGTEFRTPLAVAQNVAGLSFAPAANLNYEIDGLFMVKTATATVSPRPGCGWPTGCAAGVASIEVTSANTASIYASGHLGDNIQALGTGLPVTTNYYPAELRGMMQSGASPTGIFRVTLASETNATNVFMGVGSFLKYRTYG